MDDIRTILGQLVMKVLNERYRSFDGLSEAWFPEDEWNKQEQKVLVNLCSCIEHAGYDYCEQLAQTEEGKEKLNLLAGYYIFVDNTTCKSLLGVAIVAELLMEPFASISYGADLGRSELFANLRNVEREEILVLFHLARLARNIEENREMALFSTLNEKLLILEESAQPDTLATAHAIQGEAPSSPLLHQTAEAVVKRQETGVRHSLSAIESATMSPE